MLTPLQLNWLIPPGDHVRVMSNRVIGRDQPIVKKKMYHFKMEIVSTALPILSQTLQYSSTDTKMNPLFISMIPVVQWMLLLWLAVKLRDGAVGKM